MIAPLWSQTARRLEQLLLIQAPPEPRVVFDRGIVSAQQEVPENATIGSYNEQEDLIHLLCLRDNTALIVSTFRHEATHYFLHHAFRSLPQWLDEGLATYMEAGSLEEDTSNDHINKARLQEYKGLLTRNRVPRLADFIYGKTTNLKLSESYAVCWALVFSLLHHQDATIQEQRRILLRRLLDVARQDGIASNQIVAKTFFAAIDDENGQSDDWEMQWHRELWRLSE
jgi:hypothetical protein